MIQRAQGTWKNKTKSIATLLLVALLSILSTRAAVYATQPPAEPAPSSAPSWEFDDEAEQEPGWREIAGAQALDLGLFAAFTALAMVSFFRKSVPLKHVTFAAAVLYLGFAKSQLISISTSSRWLTGACRLNTALLVLWPPSRVTV